VLIPEIGIIYEEGEGGKGKGKRGRGKGEGEKVKTLRIALRAATLTWAK